MPAASCMLARAPVGSEAPGGGRKFVIRPYTPVNAPGDAGRLDLVVKEYKDGECWERR